MVSCAIKTFAQEERESERASFAHILNPQELLEGYRGQGASISLKDPPSPSPRPVVVAGRLCLYLPQIMSGCIQLAPSKGADEQPSRAPASGIDGKAI